MSAFDGLYERHVTIASTVARRNVDNQSDAEDVVAEAFQSVLQSLTAGKGPDTFFRAYLLSTVTRLSHQRNRKAGRVLPSGDDSVLDQTLSDSDAAISAFESRTVAKAFRALPERWQAVLWYLDVERMKPAVVAPILGLSANAVSALALRAREGLRRQYLQCHLADQADGSCSEYVSKLGNYIRGGLSKATERKVRDHLHGCSTCTAAFAELSDVQGTMRAVVLPLITGVPLVVWAGKGAGLGVLGGVVPVKAVLAQPAIMAMVAAAAVGLVLGAVGVVDYLTPDAYLEQQAVETRDAALDTNPVLPTPGKTPTSAPVPVVPVPMEPPPVAAPAESEPPAAEPPAEEPPGPAAAAPTLVIPSPVAPPVNTPSPSTSAVPPRSGPADVEATARRTGDPGSGSTPMEVDFRVSGAGPLGRGRALFSVGQYSRIVEGSLRAPKGWTCSMESRSVVSCVTDSVQREDLRFHFEADSKRDQNERVLSYTLAGPELAPKKFSSRY